MNPQLTTALANHHRQDLERAARAARLAGEIQRSRWSWSFAPRPRGFRLGFGLAPARPSLDAASKF